MQTLDAQLGPSLVRPYFLCNSPREKGRSLICVRREDAGRSRTLHRDLTMGRRLRISLPVLQTSALGERAVVHHSDQADAVRAGLPAELRVPEPDTAVHVCGPDGFMTHVVAEATAAGRHPGQLHTERFAPAAPPSAETGTGAEAGTGAGTGDGAKAGDATAFTVRIACTGTGTGCPVPADSTIAEVLTAHSVEVDLSCEQGIRGACPTPVLAGEPDHRDEVQSPDERAAGDRITHCCSRARTPELLLDL